MKTTERNIDELRTWARSAIKATTFGIFACLMFGFVWMIILIWSDALSEWKLSSLLGVASIATVCSIIVHLRRKMYGFLALIHNSSYVQSDQ